MPILTYSTDLENVDPIAYFARNFVKLAILKRFEVVLYDHNGAAFQDYIAQLFFISFDNYQIKDMNDDDWDIKFGDDGNGS